MKEGEIKANYILIYHMVRLLLLTILKLELLRIHIDYDKVDESNVYYKTDDACYVM